MESNSKIETLRGIVNNAALAVDERRDAAEHLLKLKIAAVETAGVEANDPEIVELRKPWPRTTASHVWMADYFASATSGRSLHGWTLPDAKEEVLKRRKLRVVLETVCDETLDRIERLAAARFILDNRLHPHAYTNGYTAEHLLEKVLPADATRWDSDGPHPVRRPPLSMADVW